MNGWMGKILRVNLSNGEINAEALDPQIARDFVGGRGLAIYYMLKEVDPNCDALGKENVKTKDQTLIEGKLQATQEHLNDMREITKHVLKMKRAL